MSSLPVIIDSGELSHVERDSYAACLRVIVSGTEKVRVILGMQEDALKQIRDERLYREEFATFEEFCRVKLGITPRGANLRILAQEVVSGLLALPSTEGIAPPTKLREAIALAPVPAEQRPAVWAAVNIQARIDGKKITGERVKAAVDAYLGRKRGGMKMGFEKNVSRVPLEGEFFDEGSVDYSEKAERILCPTCQGEGYVDE